MPVSLTGRERSCLASSHKGCQMPKGERPRKQNTSPFNSLNLCERERGREQGKSNGKVGPLGMTGVTWCPGCPVWQTAGGITLVLGEATLAEASHR